MKVKVIKNFRDRTEDLQLRSVGDVLNVDKDRAEALISLGLAEEVEEKLSIKDDLK